MSHVRGIAVSLLASCLFGGLYYYATVLRPLTGFDIYGWRILFTLPCLTAFMAACGYWPLVTAIGGRLGRERLLLPSLVLSSFLFGIQLWLFMWAPLNGKALEVSLGYLLMPLVMVVCGRFVYKERLFPFQKAAVALAGLGVLNQGLHLGSLSWEIVVVTVGFPCYFLWRRRLGTDNLGGLWFDMAFMLPAAVWAIATSATPTAIVSEHPRLFWQIPLLGIISASAIGCYIMASRMLPMSLFGLLSYVEPVLLVVVSLLVGESIRPEENLTYLGVGLALAVLAIGGLRRVRKQE